VSLHILATGALIADPARRTGSKGPFVTATIRVATDDGSILVSIIAFHDQAERLLGHQQGQTISMSGRARLNSWTGRDGKEQHGLALVAEAIASAATARRADADRRQRAS
jgi:single-stranded DNA-binding protein